MKWAYSSKDTNYQYSLNKKQNINSPISINNTKFVVKNLATKVTPTRFEISKKF